MDYSNYPQTCTDASSNLIKTIDIIFENILTILTGKNFNSNWITSFIQFSRRMAGRLLLIFSIDMFTQSVKFYYTLYYHVLRVLIFEKSDSLNRQ